MNTNPLALVIVDMQQAVISNSDKHDSVNVMQRINILARAVRQSAAKVIFIQHDGEAEEGLLPFTQGWQIAASLKVKDSDIVIRKTTNDAFYDTQLAEVLEQSKIQQLIFCGWATDFCVDSSIKAAISRDFQVTVAADCHTVSDRAFLSAVDVINYHNWLWSNLLSLNTPVQVEASQDIVKRIHRPLL
jgi:nicotinamidase-related amidase